MSQELINRGIQEEIDMQTTREAQQSGFAVGPDSRLTVDSASGDMSIQGGAEGRITIQTDDEETIGDKRIECTQDGNHVTVKAIHAGRHADLKIGVPADCACEVHTASGDVGVTGIKGVSVQSGSGDVIISATSHDVRANTASGDIRVEDPKGRLSLESASGDIQVERSNAGSWHLKTASGDITVDSSLAREGDYSLGTTSGEMVLNVPPGAGFDVEFTTVSGHPHALVPAEVLNSDRRQWTARLGGGGAKVRVHSTSGDLTIGQGSSAGQGTDRPKRGSSEEVDDRSEGPQPEGGGQTDDETLSVLRSLEAGDLTLDEASRKLDELGEG